MKIKLPNGLWNWHSRGIGGKNVIDYLIFVRGYCFVDAVRALAGEDYVYQKYAESRARPPDTYSRPPKPLERNQLVLPQPGKDKARITAYLRKREIDEALIRECISNGSLYERADYRNPNAYVLS
jgi:hypothetical protein